MIRHRAGSAHDERTGTPELAHSLASEVCRTRGYSIEQARRGVNATFAIYGPSALAARVVAEFLSCTSRASRENETLEGK